MVVSRAQHPLPRHFRDDFLSVPSHPICVPVLVALAYALIVSCFGSISAECTTLDDLNCPSSLRRIANNNTHDGLWLTWLVHSLNPQIICIPWMHITAIFPIMRRFVHLFFCTLTVPEYCVYELNQIMCYRNNRRIWSSNRRVAQKTRIFWRRNQLLISISVH